MAALRAAHRRFVPPRFVGGLAKTLHVDRTDETLTTNTLLEREDPLLEREMLSSRERMLSSRERTPS